MNRDTVAITFDRELTDEERAEFEKAFRAVIRNAPAKPSISIIVNTMYAKVKEFHETFGHPRPLVPTFIDAERLRVRRKWADEEREEFDEALAKRDLVGCADALADELYFLLGTCVEMGLPMDAIFAAVHAANMAKANHQEPHTDNCDLNTSHARCTCGKLSYNEKGKVLKPEGWRGPEGEIKRILYDADRL